jgi:zinc protease
VQSIGGISNVVSRIVDNNLPRDWWAQYIAQVNATTPADVAAVSAKYMDPDHLIIVIVGDGARISDGVRATAIAPVVVLDKTGKKTTP